MSIRTKLIAGLAGLALLLGPIYTAGPARADIGEDWQAIAAAEANQWQSVIYGGGQYVAVSDSGTNRVMTSPDGITWTGRTAAENNGWWGLTYGAGKYVAVAHDGANRVMTSPDGMTWTSQSAAEANQWIAVAYGAGTFVAISTDGTNRVMTSPDGITWTSQSAAENNSWISVIYAGGQFVAVSWDGTNRVMTSPDGITWTSRAAAEASGWWSVTYGGGQYVAVAFNGANRVMTSPDGITWTSQAAAEANQWVAVTYGGGQYVAVAYDGTNRVMTSPDGITWTSQAAAESNGWLQIAYHDGMFASVGDSGTNRVMVSYTPSITSVSPGSGEVGAAVTLTGKNLAQTSSVTFGGVAASFTVVNATQITATAPSTSGTVAVAAVSPGGTASGTFTYTAPAPPAPQPGPVVPPGPTPTTAPLEIQSVSPATGPASGGTEVTIKLTGAIGPSAVSIAGRPAQILNEQAGQVSILTPAGVPGAAPLVVTSGGQQAEGAFTYTQEAGPLLVQRSLTVRFAGGSTSVSAKEEVRIRKFLQGGTVVNTRIIGYKEAGSSRAVAKAKALSVSEIVGKELGFVRANKRNLNGLGNIKTFPQRAGSVYLTIWELVRR